MLAGESPHAMVCGLGELLAPLSLHLVEGLEKPVDGAPGPEPALLSLGSHCLPGHHQGPPRLRCLSPCGWPEEVTCEQGVDCCRFPTLG